MKAFDILATRVVILLVEARDAKRTIHIQPIRELKIKKPKHSAIQFAPNYLFRVVLVNIVLFPLFFDFINIFFF